MGAVAFAAAVVSVIGPATTSVAQTQPTTTTHLTADTRTACSTSALSSAVSIKDVSVTSAVPEKGTFTSAQGTLTDLPAFCDVTLADTDSAGNVMHISLWLPGKWNGMFQGTGGAGFLCGPFYAELADGITSGYASAGTDCGSADPTGGFALKDGKLDWPLIDDFAYRGIHDMTAVGKVVTDDYYRSDPHYAFFNGCSTGGREGLMEAQRYPDDYNGIVSAAPAINWTKFIPSEIWPELVMLRSNDFLPTCIEDAFVEAVTRACGGIDGVIENPAQCKWSPYALVGLVTPCGTVTRGDAAVMKKIWKGPTAANGKSLWYGLEPGASLAGLAGTTTSTSGVTTGSPFSIAVAWLGTWLQKDPTWNWETLTYAEFYKLFDQSVKEFSSTIATNNPNLTAFKDHGGKLIMWHGLADQLIFTAGSINYYQRVEATMGGAKKTATFARFYLAPGAQHCASDAGPAPGVPYDYPDTANPLPALVKWVKTGQAPSSILAVKEDTTTGVVLESRPLCLYPALAKYRKGNPNLASSYACR